VIRRILAIMVLLAAAGHVQAATCHGRFPNPVSDICWSCVMPLTFGGVKLAAMDQEDNDTNVKRPICTCGNPPRVGISIGFWEPVRLIEVVRQPYCFPTLGGLEMDVGIHAPAHGRGKGTHGTHGGSFYQAHWYAFPIIALLEVLLDSNCLDAASGFDLAYITEVDPLWNESELTFILNPDAALFTNPLAQAVCAADCVAATAGFPLNSLFWCAGCQGSMYPLNGNINAHIGGVQASTLIAQRMLAKMHRELLIWSASGSRGQCGYYPQPLMDKRNYKFTMLHPIPQTKKIAGRCCQPFGRTTALWGAGREFPYKGEDFSYLVFRKRDCCASVISPGG
jgi:conjugal transfer pilus assembly protein TraU